MDTATLIVKRLFFLEALDHSRWNEIKGGARIGAGGPILEGLDGRRFNWTILGCMLRRRRPFGGRKTILITVIGTDASGYFAFIGPSELSERVPDGLYLIIPYSLSSGPEDQSSAPRTAISS